MKVCFVGLSKTGSNSFWDMMKLHPQIASSYPKEPLQNTMVKINDYPYILPYTEYNFNDYLNHYQINNNTRVLFDGTVSVLFYIKNIVSRLYQQSYVDKVCCVYVYRNTIDRFFSSVNDLTKLYLVDKSYIHKPKFLNNDLTINDKHLNRWANDEGNQYKAINKIFSNLNTFSYSRKDDKIGKLLIVPLSKLEESQKNICDFLEVDQYHLKLEKLNQAKNKKENIISLKVKYNLIKWFRNNFDMLKKLSEENERMIYKKWGIELNEKYDEEKYRKYFSICRNRR